MSNLFISHSSRDNAAAKELQDKLEEQGHRSVFLDLDPETGIQAGVSWERTLYTKLRACRAVVVLCSDNYLSSQWCFAEVALARMEGKQIFVLQVDPWSGEVRMPSILTEEQYIDLRANQDDGYQRLRNGFKVKGIVPSEAREWTPAQPPYPGLRAFDESDAAIFFGRDEEIAAGRELLNRVQRQGHPRLVMVLGSSGSGKSSLVRAGIIPQMRRNRRQWLVVKPFRPGAQPSQKLAVSLSHAFDSVGQAFGWEEITRWLEPSTKRELEPQVLESSESDETEPTAAVARDRLLQALNAMQLEFTATDNQVAALVHRLKDYLDGDQSETPFNSSSQAGPSVANPLAEIASRLRLQSGFTEASVVLIVDQFEELLDHEAEHPASLFLEMLRVAIEAPDSPLLVIGTMRSDYLGLLQRSEPLLGLGFKSLSVGPMSKGSMRQIIEEPALLGQIQLEKGLSDLLLEDTETSDALPLLAFTLRMMWDRYRDDRLLAISEYNELGGLQGAVAQVADETFKDILEQEQDTSARATLAKELRDAFLSMARPAAEGSGWSRQAVSWDGFSESVQSALALFIDPRRLLVKRSDGSVEVAHEALFRSWNRLKGWLDENSEALHLLQEIQVEAKKWSEASTEDDKEPYLWRGGRLARAIELKQGGVLALNDLDRSFIQASHRAEQAISEAAEARRQRELRKARVFALVVGVLCLLALAAFVIAYIQRNTAIEQELKANSGRLAVLAKNQLDHSLDTALLLGVQAVQTASTLEARSSLADVLAHSPRLIRFLHGHSDRVRGVAFSPIDPTQLASASFDETTRIWDLTTLETVAVIPDTADVNKISFNPAGTVLATAGDNPIISLWDVAEPQLTKGPQLVGDLLGHSDVVFSAVFIPPNGKLLASASEDRTVLLWDVDKREKIGGPLSGHSSHVLSLAISPDGKRLASGSRDRTIILWDVASATRQGEPLQGHGDNAPADAESDFGYVEGLAFSPIDNTLLVSAGRDRKIRFWDVGAKPPALLGVPLLDEERVMEVAFRSDGKLLASSNYNGELRLWDTSTRKAVGKPLTGHARAVRGLAFSPDGKRLASAGDDSKIGLWNVENPLQLPSFWQTRVFHGHDGGVASVAFSPDGELVASAGYDKTIRLWNVANGEAEGLPLAGHTDSAVAVAFSPDGERLASGGNDKTVRIWDIATAEQLGTPLEHGEAVESVAFSADGKRLASASRDGKVRLWDVETSQLVGNPLDAHANVFSVAFSPDGSLLFAGLNSMAIGDSNTGQQSVETIRVWDLSASQPTVVENAFRGHRESVFGLAVSANGKLLTSASRDRTVTVWDIDRRKAVGEPLVGHGNGVLSVSLSPKGDRVASASYDRTIRLWDVATGQAIGPPLLGHDDVVESVVFSPDGKLLASASFDGTIRLWNTDESAWTARACKIANRNLTLKEWQQYIGKDVAYCRTCPELPAPKQAPKGAPSCRGVL